MTARADSPGTTSRFEWPDLLLLLAVLALGIFNLGQPFIWDGAFFTLCAEKLAAGGKLYRDVWDVKQPGLFWFFEAGGRLFGFREIGIRAFDVLWMGGLALVMRAALGRWYSRGWLASLAALLSVGYAYAFAEESHLGQVEWLAGLPLLVTLWAAIRARESARGSASWALLSGLAGGAALVFKLPLLPLVGVLWLVALWPARGAEGAAEWPLARAIRALALVAAGAAIVAIAVALVFLREGTLREATWTWFTYPRVVFSQIHGVRFRTLFEGLLWFAPRWAPVLGLGWLGATGGARRDRWTLGFLAWLVAGAAVLLIQRFSYWQYHFLLFVVPLGALAARGFESLERALAAGAGTRGALARTSALVSLLCTWALLSGATKALYFVHDGFLRSEAAIHRSHLRLSHDGVYGKVLDEVKFLSEPGARAGPIFEIGNPLFTFLAGRQQAGPRNPSMLMEFMTAAEWEVCARDLVTSRPAYVFIHRDFTLEHPPVFERSAPFRRVLEERFEVARRSAVGTWYAPRGSAAASAPAAR